MQIHIIAVGKAKQSPESELFDEYKKRLDWSLQLHEVIVNPNLPDAKRIEEEGEQMLAKIPDNAIVIALDEKGKHQTSEGFAKLIGDFQEGGDSTFAFLIGGADGLSKACKQRANSMLAFGNMTWPHMLVRAMLSEQLYRACMILKGHPYHRA